MLVPFHELTGPQMAEVVAIYDAYFDVPWEWPHEELQRLAHTPRELFQGLAALAGDAVAGLAVADYLPAGRIWHLRYLAIHPDLRGQGWGSRMLAEIVEAGEIAARANGHAGCVGALLEVEALEGAAPGAELEERVRRQNFYRRHGALMTGARCPRPPAAPAEMPHFDLMLIPMSAWEGPVTDALRYHLMRSLMVEAYSVAEDEPWLLAALKPYEQASQ